MNVLRKLQARLKLPGKIAYGAALLAVIIAVTGIPVISDTTLTEFGNPSDEENLNAEETADPAVFCVESNTVPVPTKE